MKIQRRGGGSSYKSCAKCGEIKPINDFHRDSTRPDGRKTRCKPCRNHQVYQSQLQKMLDSGKDSIRKCNECEDLHMSTDPRETLCPQCRKQCN